MDRMTESVKLRRLLFFWLGGGGGSERILVKHIIYIAFLRPANKWSHHYNIKLWELIGYKCY